VKVLLDTSAYSALMSGDERVAGVVRSSEQIVIPAVVMGELLYGFAGGNRSRQNRKQLELFLESDRVVFQETDRSVCERYALVMHHLRAKGRPIPTNDVWIGAHALAAGADLVTLDQRFSEIEGLILSMY